MRALLTLALLGAALAGPRVANASPPANDAFASATSVAALPFADQVDSGELTIEPNEPMPCWSMSQSAWWSYTAPANGAIRAGLALSNIATSLNVYRASGGAIEALSFFGCAAFGNDVTLPVRTGETYYFQAGSLFGESGSLRLQVTEVPPPLNDDFVNAAAITSIPYGDVQVSTSATVEPGEPLEPSAAHGPIAASTWYSFTAPSSGSYVLQGSVPCTASIVTAYTGGSLAGLTETASSSSGRLLLPAQVGTTYRIQLGRGPTGCWGSMSLSVHAAEPISASFWNWPFDPSSFETVQFSNTSWDPEGTSIVSAHWDLGDGTTFDGCCPSHRYAGDGDYVVSLDVATADGRTGSLTRTIQVRTHDVGIAKLAVPQSASAGQTKAITVGISNTRYPEAVTVRLLRSVPGGGFEQVGSLTQSAPVRGGGRTTAFAVNYTFTTADASVGKVTFRAIADLGGARDALPADNDVTALATKVAR